MGKKRFRLLAGLAGTTLCLFALSGYAQNTSTPATSAPQSGSVSTPQTGTDATASPQTTTGGGATVTGTETRTATQGTTTTTTTTFPGGVLGILAVAVLILLVLFAVFRGRDSSTVVRETSVSSSAASPRAGTATSDVPSARAASGASTTNDPNARR
jgi:hypothetical protein